MNCELIICLYFEYHYARTYDLYTSIVALFKTKFNISIFMVYFDLFYKKIVMCSLFSTFYFNMGTKLSERRDE